MITIGISQSKSAIRTCVLLTLTLFGSVLDADEIVLGLYQDVHDRAQRYVNQGWIKKKYAHCDVKAGFPVFFTGLGKDECTAIDSLDIDVFVRKKMGDSISYWVFPLYSDQTIEYSVFLSALLFKYNHSLGKLDYVGGFGDAYTIAELVHVWPAPKYHVAIISFGYASLFTVLGRGQKNMTPILLNQAREFMEDPFVRKDALQIYLQKKDPDFKKYRNRLEYTYDFFENITIEDLPNLAKKSAFRNPEPYSKTVRWIKEKLCVNQN